MIPLPAAMTSHFEFLRTMETCL